MCYCYVLLCSDGSYYTGSTKNIRNRLISHNKGSVKYTKYKRPVELIFLKIFNNFNEAFRFELNVKSWKKRKSIIKMLNKPDNIANKNLI